MPDDVYADIDLIDDGVDEANPPEDVVEDYPDDEPQNHGDGDPEDADPVLQPDLPDEHDGEWDDTIADEEDEA